MLEEIRYKRAVARTDIREVLSDLGIDFEEIMSELRFVCINPAHKDSTPSCTINFNPNSEQYTWFSCFGCDYSGSLPKLVSAIKDISIAEAKKYIITFDSGIAVKKRKQGCLERVRRRRKVKIQLPEEFQLFDLDVQNSYLKYLLRRGVLERDIRKYQWGYCAKGYYRKRVVLPIYMKGKLVNLFARHITTDVESKKVRNARFAEVERVVFPYDELDFELKYIWVTESAFNVFRLKRIRLPNLICLFGNKLTEWKLKLLSRFEEVRLIPDGDEGGDELVRKARKNLHKSISVQSVDMIRNEDAASIKLSQARKVLETLHEVQAYKVHVRTNYSMKK